MRRDELTQELLMQELEYNPETGIFLRAKYRKGKYNVGDVAGSKPDPNGYVGVRVKNKLYKAHRLAWLYVYGEWPNEYIDHKNGDRSDNRIDNLRAASPSENMHNRKINANNKVGVKGVSKCSDCNTWIVQIRHNKVNYYKRFKDFDIACEFAEFLREELHGVYARLK